MTFDVRCSKSVSTQRANSLQLSFVYFFDDERDEGRGGRRDASGDRPIFSERGASPRDSYFPFEL